MRGHFNFAVVLFPCHKSQKCPSFTCCHCEIGCYYARAQLYLLHAERDGVKLCDLADDELGVATVQPAVLLQRESEALQGLGRVSVNCYRVLVLEFS